MIKLPNGYYAVDNSGDDKSSFTYKGVEYSAVRGENLFSSLAEAVNYAKEIPECVLDGLDYESFSSPVILFSAGEHEVKNFVFVNSVVLLGQNAGIDPNVRGEDKTEPPALNPEREKNESVLKGSYWFGKMDIVNESTGDITIDGFSSVMLRLSDSRKRAVDHTYRFRNIIQVSPCGKSLYVFGSSDTFRREIYFENIRVDDYDDLDYGAMFALTNAQKTVFDKISYNNSCQMFGLTNICRLHKNACGHTDVSEVCIKNSYFGHLSGDVNFNTSCPNGLGRALKLEIVDCAFVDASQTNNPVINPQMPDGRSETMIRNCTFTDTRYNTSSVVSVSGSGNCVKLENCEINGFANEITHLPKLPTEAPDYIDAPLKTTDTEDPHEIIKGDYCEIEKYYEGRKAYYGDLHVHTSCGGTSDGKYPMKDWPTAMDEKKLDFAAVVDHRQMRGYFLPEWDDERFIIGTEPGTRILDLNFCRHNQSEIHYNMLFPHKYGLAMVLANFPEFEFHGDELNGSFKYPKFTKERFRELSEYVQSIGGIIVHPHPKTMLASDDPLDYYFCEHMFLETIYGAYSTHASFKNYKLWTELLKAGKHVYSSCGSDTHGNVSNAAVATFYTKEKNGRAFFEQMRSADFTSGAVGMKMMIDGNPMGSEIEYCNGMKLSLITDDFYAPALNENTSYELRIITDKGLAYNGMFNGKKSQRISINVQKRRFYRAEIFDMTHGYLVAIGNPIWLDKAAED